MSASATGLKHRGKVPAKARVCKHTASLSLHMRDHEDRNFQSRSKFSIPIENFNPRVSIYGALVVYRKGLDRKFQSTIDRSKFSIPKAAIEFFNSRALWVLESGVQHHRRTLHCSDGLRWSIVGPCSCESWLAFLILEP